MAAPRPPLHPGTSHCPLSSASSHGMGIEEYYEFIGPYNIEIPRRRRSWRRKASDTLLGCCILLRMLGGLVLTFGGGTLWLLKALQMTLYGLLLMPGVVRALTWYMTSYRVIRKIEYGKGPRSYLDVYLPPAESFPGISGTSGTYRLPVIIYVNGGAWILGHRIYAVLLGRYLSEQGVVLMSVDYRNFPQGTISDMEADVAQAVAWVLREAGRYSGDPSQVLIMAHGSGAHVAAQAFLQQANRVARAVDRGGAPSIGRSREELELELTGCAGQTKNAAAGRDSGTIALLSGRDAERGVPPHMWSPNDLQAFIGVSGGYSIPALVDTLDQRGLSCRAFLSIMEGGASGARALEALPRHSPEHILKAPGFKQRGAVAFLCPTVLLHGGSDRTMPSQQSTSFAKALSQAGRTDVQVQVFPGRSHTDLVLEDVLLMGERAPLIRRAMRCVEESCPHRPLPDRTEAQKADAKAPFMAHWLVQLARKISPF
ncbi:unnamed protein product [Pedinophyceae sp. YPF-701]|nr:unnamed protein product [Pedinophyceae sp. YPF-701]